MRRDFAAQRPNRRWVVDFTYVRTWSGFCYTAFVMDLHSRRVVGWATSTRMDTDLALGALEQAIWQRKDREGRSLAGLVHRCDHGSQCLSICYADRLAEEGIDPSTGAVGSSYDNAAAEALNKSYKRELVWPRTWRAAMTWRPPPAPGSTGTTTSGLTAPTPTSCRRQPPRTTTTITPPSRPPLRRDYPPSTKPGTVR